MREEVRWVSLVLLDQLCGQVGELLGVAGHPLRSLLEVSQLLSTQCQRLSKETMERIIKTELACVSLCTQTCYLLHGTKHKATQGHTQAALSWPKSYFKFVRYALRVSSGSTSHAFFISFRETELQATLSCAAIQRHMETNRQIWNEILVNSTRPDCIDSAISIIWTSCDQAKMFR